MPTEQESDSVDLKELEAFLASGSSGSALGLPPGFEEGPNLGVYSSKSSSAPRSAPEDPWSKGNDPWSNYQGNSNGSYGSKGYQERSDQNSGNGWWSDKTKSSNGNGNGWWSEDKGSKGNDWRSSDQTNGSGWTRNERDPRLVGEESAKVEIQQEDPTTEYLSVSSWDELNLPKEILDGIFEMGFVKPSKIQEWTLPIALKGGNIIGQARNGSGKTAAFALAMLISVDSRQRCPQGMCLCPTRELAAQNHDVVSKLGKFTGMDFLLAVPRDEKFPRKALGICAYNAQMVAERPGLTWKAWALEGADAGRLLNGRERLSTGYNGYKLQTDAQVTHQPRPRAQTEMPHAHANQRKSHGDGKGVGPWRELIAVSPSNETKRSTAASSGPQSPRYEGEPHHDGIAVWRDTQSLAESLAAEPSPRRSFKGRSPVTSPLRQRPPSASLLSDRVQASEMMMPPWMSTLGLSNASQVSHPSPSHNFAEAALGRLAWLQAEKEEPRALEGWLSNAGYLSMDKENEIHRSHRTNDHSISSDVKIHSEAFQHSEAEPVMERHVERIGAMALNHLSQERSSEMLGPIETNEHLERRATSLRRTSVLEERNYQALATERAAAEAKLRKDLRAVALERWSEPLNPERQDRHEGLGEQHGIVQPRNSAPPSGVREVQAFRAFPESEISHAPASLPRGSGNLAAVVNQPGTSLARRGSSQASVVEESSTSRHSSPAKGHYSSMTATGLQLIDSCSGTAMITMASFDLLCSSDKEKVIKGRCRMEPAPSDRGSYNSPEAQQPSIEPWSTDRRSVCVAKFFFCQAAGPRLPRGHSPSLAAKDGHLYGSRRSSDLHTVQSQSSGGSPGRQKAPSFSWPGTSSFTAEVKHPSTTTRKASVSSVYQQSSLGRARAATEAGLPSDRSRQRFLSVPDVSDTRTTKHNTPPRNPGNGELEAPHHESEGSETSSSESPEEAAQRQAQVEHDLQELAARLHVPRPQPSRKGSVGTVVNRSTVPGGPIDLLALARKTKSEACEGHLVTKWRYIQAARQLGEAGRALGVGEEVECRCGSEVESQIVVGTPGKVQDLTKRRTIDPSNFTIFVVDEADVMIDEAWPRFVGFYSFCTPSFAAAEAATGSTPKASSVKSLPHPPPPAVPLIAVGDATHTHQPAIGDARPDEFAKLREELAAAEARSNRHYEEMKEYKSWLAQVEDEAYAAEQPDPVPDNPPGLWNQHEGSNVERGSQIPDFKEWVTRISRKEHEKITLKPWPKCNDLDVWRSNVVGDSHLEKGA
eukprot:s2162_g11.t1